VLSLAAGVLAAEASVRVLNSMRGSRWIAEDVRAELLRARDQNRPFTVQAATSWFENPAEAALHLHPFFAWETGARDSELDAELVFERSPERRSAYTLLILGGSVAECFGIERQGIAPLREVLAADPRFSDKRLHVCSFGRGGNKEPQQLNRLSYLLALGIRPDGVLVLDGFNEVAMGRKNSTQGVHPVFPSSPHWAFLASSTASDRAGLDMLIDLRAAQRDLDADCDLALRWRLEYSALLGGMILGRVRALQRSCAALQDACTHHLTELSDTVVRGPAFSGDARDAMDACVRAWAECSRTMQDICRARSIHYLHVLQPTLHDAGSKVATAGEIAVGNMDAAWMEGVEIGYPMLREAGRRLCEQHVNFLDASRIFEHETQALFRDAAHLRPVGNRMLAQAIGRAFLDSMPRER
jgi:hypothetical protein